MTDFLQTIIISRVTLGKLSASLQMLGVLEPAASGVCQTIAVC